MTATVATLPPGFTYSLEALRTIYTFRQDAASNQFEKASQRCQSQTREIQFIEAELIRWTTECASWLQRASFDPTGYGMALAAFVRRQADLQNAKLILVTLEQQRAQAWASLISARLRVETLAEHRREQGSAFALELGRRAQNESDDNWVMRKGSNR